VWRCFDFVSSNDLKISKLCRLLCSQDHASASVIMEGSFLKKLSIGSRSRTRDELPFHSPGLSTRREFCVCSSSGRFTSIEFPCLSDGHPRPDKTLAVRLDQQAINEQGRV